MNPDQIDLQRAAEASLWPLIESVVHSHQLAGLAVAVVRDGEVALSRGFGVRSRGTDQPVTPETMFHLASVSKSFVATAVAELATPRPGRPPLLRLDAPIVEWVPEFTLADGRAGEVTIRHLLSHTSGLPDVDDYEWYRPQLGDEALRDFVLSQSTWKLATSPGTEFAYSNAGFELLGYLVSVVTGQTFEAAVKRLVLDPIGMHQSTFVRGDVPPELAASPHVGAPLIVPGSSYPYTRRHAPSSTLHSNLVELCRWMLANLESTSSAGGPDPGSSPLDADVLDQMWTRVAPAGHTPWMEAAGLGWFLGTYRGHRTVSHSGTDPGFGSRLVLLPEQRTGVVVLANSNTAPVSSVLAAALDLALGVRDDRSPGAPDPEVPRLDSLLPYVVGPLAATLADAGPEAAVSAYRELSSAEPAEYDLDDDGFEDAVWGAIELHRTDLVWPMLRLWTDLRPESSRAWTMSGWAHQVDGQLESGSSQLQRALELDPDNDDAAMLLKTPPPTD